MEVQSGAEEGFVREWAPCTHMLNLIPPKVQSGLFSSELNLTCIDAVDEFIALGTNVGLIYWYSRKKGDLQRLRCENNSSSISYVKIVNTVDYMVAAGNHAGQVSVFQIPKEHPDSVPDSLKPKVEPKVERYTIGDLHKSKITAIEWSKNGMKLFSGDKNGIIIMTEIDFYMHLCKSSEVVHEGYEIAQLSYHRDALLVSSACRSVVCSRQAARWQVTQLGNKERRSLCLLGGVFQWSWRAGGAGGLGGAAAAYCARPGLRLWRATAAGDVLNTIMFKEAIGNPLIVAELLNPGPRKHNALDPELNFGPLHVFRDHFLVTHNERVLYVLDPRTATAVAVVDELRRILSVSVNKDEIFVLEGPRSVVRLGVAPETSALRTEDKGYSLSSTIQQAVNTVKELTHIDQTVPFIASVLEQPITLLTNKLDNDSPRFAEECVELPPIKSLPQDISENVLESIVNEFRDVRAETVEIRRAKTEELKKKLKIYNSIMEKKHDEELIFSSKRTKKKDTNPNSTISTPERIIDNTRLIEIGTVKRLKANTETLNGPINNVQGSPPIDTTDNTNLQKEIEEKEKILAKMLNLEFLTINQNSTDSAILQEDDSHSSEIDKPMENDLVTRSEVIRNPQTESENRSLHQDQVFDSQRKVRERSNVQNDIMTRSEIPLHSESKVESKKFSFVRRQNSYEDLQPKLAKIPTNWNLQNLKITDKSKIATPDKEIEDEWEFV